MSLCKICQLLFFEVLTSMHHVTSLSLASLLGSGGWVIPKFDDSCLMTDKTTSLPEFAGNLFKTLCPNSPQF